MLNTSMTKAEIEAFLKGKGDFVQIDYLTRLLEKRDLALDRKKFVYEKLGEIYEKKRMFLEAAKMFNNISILSLTFSEKMKNHVKEAELCIKAGMFTKADDAIKKAMGEANAADKNNIYLQIKEFYKRQGEAYDRDKKSGQAIRIYEKLLEMKISDAERQEIKSRLLKLYEQTGKLKEFFTLKKEK